MTRTEPATTLPADLPPLPAGLFRDYPCSVDGEPRDTEGASVRDVDRLGHAFGNLGGSAR